MSFVIDSFGKFIMIQTEDIQLAIYLASKCWYLSLSSLSQAAISGKLQDQGTPGHQGRRMPFASLDSIHGTPGASERPSDFRACLLMTQRDEGGRDGHGGTAQ